MKYSILPNILKKEGPNFYRIDRKWQPKDLIPDPYRRNLLKDAQERFNLLASAEGELRSLDRSSLFIKILRRMRLTVREAQFAWRHNDLKFIEAIASFMIDYGTVLRYLKDDYARGRLEKGA